MSCIAIPSAYRHLTLPLILGSSIGLSACKNSSAKGSDKGERATPLVVDEGQGAGGASNGGSLVISKTGCTASCAEGSFCSLAGSCIAEGTCAEDGDCENNQVCGSDSLCSIGSQCGDETFETAPVPPNVLLLLDRSCSMPDCSQYENAIQGSNCYNQSGVDKWFEAVTAINTLTNAFAQEIRWGLELFPDNEGDRCEQAEPAVLPADNTATSVRSILTAALDDTDENFPIDPCVTNIDATIAQATALTALQDEERESFLVLLTDGSESGCSGNDSTTEANLKAAAEAGLKTIVIGFGQGVSATTLNRFAVAGQMENDDPALSYYEANDSEQLEAELGAILGNITSCEFTLDQKAADLDRLKVFADGEELSRDDADGYILKDEGQAIELVGGACIALRSPTPPELDVIFVCPDSPLR